MGWSKRHVIIFGCLIQLMSGNLRMGQETWEYKYADSWKNEYPACGGRQQSPINLDDAERSFDTGHQLNFRGYDRLPNRMTMKNNGRTVMITPDWGDSESDTPVVIKDGIEYEVIQMHFHWGFSNAGGSEHVFQNLTTPLEFHVVHRNNQLGDFENSLILAVLFKFGDHGPDVLWDIVERIPYVGDPESRNVTIPPFSISSMLSETSSDNYLFYLGSAAQPPCHEGVSWVILDKLSTVTEDQMRKFRSVKLDFNDDHNNRPIQPVNQRKLAVIPI